MNYRTGIACSNCGFIDLNEYQEHWRTPILVCRPFSSLAESESDFSGWTPTDAKSTLSANKVESLNFSNGALTQDCRPTVKLLHRCKTVSWTALSS